MGGDEGIAGRNEASALFVHPDTTELWARLVSPTDGWLVACYPRGVASADTYVYKTADGGVTWTETARPEEGWLVGTVGFISPERLIVAKRLFDDAPCFITKDGGETWEKMPLPGENLQVQSITVDGGNVAMEIGPSGSSTAWYVMTSRDLGDTWETAEVTVEDMLPTAPWRTTPAARVECGVGHGVILPCGGEAHRNGAGHRRGRPRRRPAKARRVGRPRAGLNARALGVVS